MGHAIYCAFNSAYMSSHAHHALWQTQVVLLTARSTRCSLPMRTCMFPSTPFSLHSIVIVKMACERELCSFMFVAPTEPLNREKKQCFQKESHAPVILLLLSEETYPCLFTQPCFSEDGRGMLRLSKLYSCALRLQHISNLN